MQNILITGASGNVGEAVLQYFKPRKNQRLFKATRQKNEKGDEFRYFDFENLERTKAGLEGIDVLFLLRPPHIADVPKYFGPLIEAAVAQSVAHIVFISVQGADKISFIPHAKIEKLIRKSGLAYTFIRPSYFMQNLTTTLLADIRDRNQIFLPAGNAPFLWVDVDDIGKAIATVLQDVNLYQNNAYTITGKEHFNFEEVAQMLSETLGRKIEYTSPNLLRFYFTKKKEGMKRAFILVMMALHYLPRWQKPPVLSDDFEKMTGLKPATPQGFIQNNLDKWC